MTKVLIVEDQPAMAAMVRHHVENAGFEVLAASDVDAAWDLLVSESPEAAIVDIQLPGKEGWDLLTRTRVDERTREVPLLVLTGLHGREVRERAEAFGAEFFTKPFAASALINRLHQIVHVEQEAPMAETALIPDSVEPLLDSPAAALAELAGGAAILDIPIVAETLSVEDVAISITSVEDVAISIPPPPDHDVEREPVVIDPSPSGDEAPLDLVAVPVVLLLDQYQVEGCLHMPAESGRFSDAWETMAASSRSFVPVTDAKVIIQGGPRAVATTPFLQVRKTDIRGVFPTEQ